MGQEEEIWGRGRYARRRPTIPQDSGGRLQVPGLSCHSAGIFLAPRRGPRIYETSPQKMTFLQESYTNYIHRHHHGQDSTSALGIFKGGLAKMGTMTAGPWTTWAAYPPAREAQLACIQNSSATSSLPPPAICLQGNCGTSEITPF